MTHYVVVFVVNLVLCRFAFRLGYAARQAELEEKIEQWRKELRHASGVHRDTGSPL